MIKMPDNTLTYREAAALLGYSLDYVRKLVQRGKLEAAPATGNRGRVTRASVQAYAAERGQRKRKPLDQVGERQRYRRRKEGEQ
jgi:excisionase family DNA binding protein